MIKDEAQESVVSRGSHAAKNYRCTCHGCDLSGRGISAAQELEYFGKKAEE